MTWNDSLNALVFSSRKVSKCFYQEILRSMKCHGSSPWPASEADFNQARWRFLSSTPKSHWKELEALWNYTSRSRNSKITNTTNLIIPKKMVLKIFHNCTIQPFPPYKKKSKEKNTLVSNRLNSMWKKNVNQLKERITFHDQIGWKHCTLDIPTLFKDNLCGLLPFSHKLVFHTRSLGITAFYSLNIRV